MQEQFPLFQQEKSNMHDIQKLELVKVLNRLNVLGCKYAVLTPDGEIMGDLEVKIRSSKHNGIKKPRHDFSAYNIPATIAAMKPGDVIVMKTIEGDSTTPAGLAKNISGRGVAKWGKGNFTVLTKGSTVEAMRLE